MSQTGDNTAPASTAVASGASSGEASSSPPAPASGKGKGKGNKKNKGKKGKKGKTAAPAPAPATSSSESSTESSSMEGTTYSPTPAVPQQAGIPVTVNVVTDTSQDTSCASAGVGALWCASKQKCLRAWEEPCPDYGSAPESPLAVKQTTAIQPVGTLTVGTNPTTGFYPGPAIYPPATVVTAAPLYPTFATRPVAVYPVGAPIYPVPISAPIYPYPAPATPVLYPAATAANVYRPAATVYPAVYPAVAPATVYPVVAPAPGTIGGQVDAGGCYTGAGYSYCAALARCVRPWETPCPA